MAETLKRYQPHNQSLLINTDWGIPENDLYYDQAIDKHLVLFAHRWVTEGERTALIKQARTYRLLRIAAACYLVLAGFFVLSMILQSTIEGSHKVSYYLTGVGILLVAICLLVATGLFFFRPWARSLALAVNVLLLIATVPQLGRLLSVGVHKPVSSGSTVLIIIVALAVTGLLLGTHAKLIFRRE